MLQRKYVENKYNKLFEYKSARYRIEKDYEEFFCTCQRLCKYNDYNIESVYIFCQAREVKINLTW